MANELLPRFGVYATWSRIDNQWYRSISNLGVAPTIGQAGPRLESHLFHFNGDLYDRHLLCCFSQFIRPETKFDDLQSLKAQIKNDIDVRQNLTDQHPPLFDLF